MILLSSISCNIDIQQQVLNKRAKILTITNEDGDDDEKFGDDGGTNGTGNYNDEDTNDDDGGDTNSNVGDVDTNGSGCGGSGDS